MPGQDGVNGVPDFRLPHSIRTFTPHSSCSTATGGAQETLSCKTANHDPHSRLNHIPELPTILYIPHYCFTNLTPEIFQCVTRWLPSDVCEAKNPVPWPTGDPHPALVKITEPLLYEPCDTPLLSQNPCIFPVPALKIYLYTGQFKKKVTLSHVHNEVTSEPTITRFSTIVRKSLKVCL
jgi:hypothetical protein